MGSRRLLIEPIYFNQQPACRVLIGRAQRSPDPISHTRVQDGAPSMSISKRVASHRAPKAYAEGRQGAGLLIVLNDGRSAPRCSERLSQRCAAPLDAIRWRPP